MAHIAECLANPSTSIGLNNYIARELSPHAAHEPILEESPVEGKETEKFVWRMHQPTESRKYQLFPAVDKLSIPTGTGRKSPDPEQAFAIAMAQSNCTSERPILGSALRLKAKEQNLVRRRKASVTELGTMTTVQEIAMDSPTIPGRPPLHERSISAPGNNSWRKNVFGDTMISCVSGPALEKLSENGPTPPRRNSGSPKGPLSPKSLTPLIIPVTSSENFVIKQTSMNQVRRDSDPAPDVPPKSARMFESPQSAQRTPYTPLTSSTSYTPLTASTMNTSISSTLTPNSASEGRATPPLTTAPTRGPSPMGHSRGQSESTGFKLHSMGHRRGESEASIMDRGRPKKRPDGSPIKRTLSKRSQQAEQRAFETLPLGMKASDAATSYDRSEIESLRKQAIGQAAKFEVLSTRNVDVLSRELRALDERCDYLRKTHRSLRSGRRNLHERICTYLRSPRVARFSHDSLLKQEEALSELDQSIDDWVTKLEQAENRRTRVRQKLLEHVAAALTLPEGAGEKDTQSPTQNHTVALHRAISIGGGENTPPRSPTKASSPSNSSSNLLAISPQRLAQPIQVASPLPHSVEDERHGRPSVESIRIYADSDVYALLADVEQEIYRMGEEKDKEMLHAITFDGRSSPFSLGRSGQRSVGLV